MAARRARRTARRAARRARRKGKAAKGKAAKAKADEVKVPLGRVFKVQAEAGGLKWVVAGVFFAAGSGGLPLIGFYWMLNLFTVFFNLSAEIIRSETIHYCVLLIITIAGVIACFFLDTCSFGVASARLTHRLREQGFRAFLRQDIGFFDEEAHTGGALTGFLQEKVTLIDFLTGGQLQAMIRGGFTIGMIIAMSFGFGSWQVSLYVVGAFPVMGMVMTLVMHAFAGDKIRAQQGKEQTGKKAKAEKEAGGLITEVVMAIRTVASFNMEHEFYETYQKQVDRVAQYETIEGGLAGIALGLGMSMMMYMMTGMNLYGGYLLSNNVITFQRFMTPMFMMMGGMMLIVGAILGVKDVQTAHKAAALFFEATDRKPAIDALADDGARLGEVRGDIEVKDVVFAYPTAADHRICNGYSLSIKAGQTVALSGPSGSGKSTIISLIERFYDPQSGSITLDGADIKTLNIQWLRSVLGLVARSRCSSRVPSQRTSATASSTPRRRDRGGRQDGQRARLCHHQPRQRLQHRRGHARWQALRRAEAAHLDRARAGQEAGGAAPRRGDVGARQRARSASCRRRSTRS